MAKQTRIPQEAQAPDNWDMEFTSGLLKVEPQQLYKVLARRNGKACKTCDGMDERIFQKKDAVVGENFPPFHPNCVCQAVDYDGNRLTAEGLQAEAKQQDVKEYFEELADEERFVMDALTKYLREQGDGSLAQIEAYLRGDFSSPWEGAPMAVHIKSASISEEQAKKISAIAGLIGTIGIPSIGGITGAKGLPVFGELGLLLDFLSNDKESLSTGLAAEIGKRIPNKFIKATAVGAEVGNALSAISFKSSENLDYEIDISKNYGDYFLSSHYYITIDGEVIKTGEEKVDPHSGAMARSDKAAPYLNMQTQIRIDEEELQKSKSFYKKE